MVSACLVVALALLAVQTRRLRAATKPAACGCGAALTMCGRCEIAHRFRFVSTPPDVIRWSEGGPHAENDCGGCVKYVRADASPYRG